MPYCQESCQKDATWFLSPLHTGSGPDLSHPYQQGGTVLHITYPEPRSRVGFISDKEGPPIRQFAESITLRGIIAQESGGACGNLLALHELAQCRAFVPVNHRPDFPDALGRFDDQTLVIYHCLPHKLLDLRMACMNREAIMHGERQPFGWAPLNYLAVMGLHRYGYRNEARRIARRFVMLVINEFRCTGLLFEKYDVENMTSDVQGKIKFGYTTNEPGFGWTNACTMELLDYLGCLGDLDVEQTFTSRIQLPPRTTAA